MLRITTAICTYNRYDVLPKAIESLKSQTLHQNQYRVIVVDNSPDYDYAMQMKQQYEELPFIEYIIERTPGLSNARNVAAKSCGTEFIAYMDDDAIASPDWLESIVAGFDLFGSNAAVLGGRVDPLWDVERPSWLDDSLLGFVSVVNWGGETRVAQDHEWLAGTNISFRTQDVLDCGGFDVSLGRTGGGLVLLSNEELRLLEQLKEQGKLAIYMPEASVSHLVDRRRLTQTWFRQRIAWQAVSDYIPNPAPLLEEARNHWDTVLDYFFGLPPRERNIRGLFFDTHDPEQFQKQLQAIRTISIMMFSGFEGVK